MRCQVDFQDNKNGNAVISVNATDSKSTATATFNVVVDPVEDNPTVKNPLGDITVGEDANNTTVDISNTFEDFVDENFTLQVNKSSKDLKNNNFIFIPN